MLEPRSNHVNTTEWLKHGSSQHKQRRYEHTVHFWYTLLKNESLLHPLKHADTNKILNMHLSDGERPAGLWLQHVATL